MTGRESAGDHPRGGSAAPPPPSTPEVEPRTPPSASRLRSDGGQSAADDDPTDEEVVRTAAAAAEGVIFDRYKQSEVTDFDVTVTFEDGVLDVDVYLNAPPDGPDAEAVVDEAVRAATAAVDELFAA